MAGEINRIKGRQLVLYVGEGDPTMATAICLVRECSLNIQTEKLETSGPASYFKTYIYSYVGATITAESIVAYNVGMNIVQLQEFALQRKIVSYRISAFQNGGVIYKGQMIIDSVEQTAPNADYATFTLNATVTGEPILEKVDTIKDVYLADFSGVRLPGCPNVYPVRIYWYDHTVIGIAFDPVDVISIFNQYSGNTELTLTGFSSGCDFTLKAAWSASFVPDFIPASPISDDVALSDEYINIIGDGDGNGLSPSETA